MLLALVLLLQASEPRNLANLHAAKSLSAELRNRPLRRDQSIEGLWGSAAELSIGLEDEKV